MVGAQPTVPTLHCNTSVPRPKLVAVVVGALTDVTVPLPEITLHVPVPTAGLFPFSTAVGELMHMV